MPDMVNLTASLVSGPTVGVLSDYIDGGGDHPLLVDGSFVFTPPPHWHETTTFQFDVSDGILASRVYTVTINVIETAPTDSDITESVLHDQVLTVAPQGVLVNAKLRNAKLRHPYFGWPASGKMVSLGEVGGCQPLFSQKATRHANHVPNATPCRIWHVISIGAGGQLHQHRLQCRQ